MNRQLWFIICCSVLYTNTFTAQQVSGRLSTSFYAWEKFDSVGRSTKITRAFQIIQLDASHGDLSFHSYLSGATNLTQSFSDGAIIRVNNAFLRWNNILDATECNIGRIPIFAGVGNGIVDGLLLKARMLNDRLTATGYGGANVTSDLKSNAFDDLNKNFLIGGQVIGRPIEGGRIGVSYVNRYRRLDGYSTDRLDSLYNPIQFFVPEEIRSEQILGTDVSYYGDRISSLYGRYDVDLNAKRNLRAEISMRVHAMGSIGMTGGYIYREPRIIYNSYFSIFPITPVREYEGGVDYTFCPSVTAYGKFAYVQFNDDMSRRVTLGCNYRYGNIAYAGTNGYAGEISTFSAQGMYPVWQRSIVPSVGVSFSTYRLNGSASQQEELFSASIGCALHPSSSLSLDTQLQWLHNAVVQNDVRFFGKFNYWFSYTVDHSQQKESGND